MYVYSFYLLFGLIFRKGYSKRGHHLYLLKTNRYAGLCSLFFFYTVFMQQREGGSDGALGLQYVSSPLPHKWLIYQYVPFCFNLLPPPPKGKPLLNFPTNCVQRWSTWSCSRHSDALFEIICFESNILSSILIILIL